MWIWNTFQWNPKKISDIQYIKKKYYYVHNNNEEKLLTIKNKNICPYNNQVNLVCF